MKSFRTDVRVNVSQNSISHKNSVFTVGSCFADAIGSRLDRFKFTTLVNPFGAIYNPVSLHSALNYAIKSQLPPEDSYLIHDTIHLNYHFHSKIYGLSEKQLKIDLREKVGSSHQFLKKTDWLIMTYGTSFVYTRKDNGEVVANCHKMNGNLFTKSLLSENEMLSSFGNFYELVQKLNPEIKIILTVSPVRHLKDTAELNNVSKSMLRIACHEITQKFKNVEYFPAFEIMMDDLRDYRFYKSDMIHPSEEAEEYIWEKFGERFFNAETKIFLRDWQSILSDMNHKPFHPQSDKHQQFLRNLFEKIEKVRSIADVDDEMQIVKSQMI